MPSNPTDLFIYLGLSAAAHIQTYKQSLNNWLQPFDKSWKNEHVNLIITSCRRAAATTCLRPLPPQVDNIFVFIRQVAPGPACWLFKTSATSWPFDLESGVRVTCDVGYLRANFSRPRPLCSRVTPDVRDRHQTDVRQKHRLMPPPYGAEA